MGKNNELDNITYPVYKKLVKRASVVYPVDNISNMSDNDINNLKAGDVVVKKTGNQRHAYIVSYKEDKQGICLTYVDGSGYMETISYDYTGGHWVYNSKDVTQAQTQANVDSRVEALVEGGTLDNAKPIYCHPILIRKSNLSLMLTCLIFNNSPTEFNLTTFKQWIDDTTNSLPDNATLRIMISGSFVADNKLAIASYFYKLKSNGQYGLGGQCVSENATAGEAFVQSNIFNDVIPSDSSFYDGVNKIN